MKQPPTPPRPPERRLVFRVSGGGRPEAGLPLAVRSAGDYRVAGGWREVSGPKWFLELFWTERGGGTYWLGGKSWRARTGDVFIYDAGEPHHLEAGPDGWDYRFLTVDSTGAGPVRTLFGLPRHLAAGPCPSPLFDRLIALLEAPTAWSSREASITAYAIFEAASRRVPVRDANEAGLAAAVQAEFDRNFARADLGVDTVAQALGVHRTTVRRAFLAAFGVCPSTYLARKRLQHALTLLRTTPLPIAEVAGAAGFRSPEYLARVVRAEVGHPPSKFRTADPGRPPRR
jgi:AraC-like DNA-binding protein